MKRTLSNLLGISALAIAGIVGSFIAATPAQAQANPPWTPFSQNGVNCSILTGHTKWPGNGNLFYCGPVNRLNDGLAIANKLELEPTATNSVLANKPVVLFVFANWATYAQFSGVPLPSGINPAQTLGYSNFGPTVTGYPVSVVVQNLTTSTGSRDVTVALLGTMQHEVGHQLDYLLNPPTGQVHNSQVKTSSGVNTIFYSKLVKDITYLNGLRPCVDVFWQDKINNNTTPVCTGGQGGTLIPSLAGKSNWVVMQTLYPYYFTQDITTPYNWTEFWAETYSVVTSNGTQVLEPGRLYDYYLKNIFTCTNTFVKGMRNNGTPPAQSAYLTRCQ